MYKNCEFVAVMFNVLFLYYLLKSLDLIHIKILHIEPMTCQAVIRMLEDIQCSGSGSTCHDMHSKTESEVDRIWFFKVQENNLTLQRSHFSLIPLRHSPKHVLKCLCLLRLGIRFVVLCVHMNITV